jgi:Subtilase family
MSRTTLLCLLVVALLALAAGPAAAAVPAWQAADRAPHALPAPGAHAAAAAAARDWLIGARPSRAARRIARAHGARPLLLRGAYALPAGRARAFAAALRRRGLLRWSEPDRTLVRQSAFEGNGGEAMWARGSVVAPGLTPPARLAPIGVLDDVVDRGVPDVAQAKVVAKSPITSLDQESGREIAHGTEVASVAAAQADGSGVIGIAPGAPILSWGFKDLSCQEVVDGLLAVVDAGAEVVNLSFAISAEDEADCHALRLAIAGAFASDALIVAAAGNELTQGNPIVYPAAYPHVLSVGALDLGLQPAYFSSAGAALDLAAPGTAVPVAVPVRLDTDGTADGVTRADGTSFAAPIVAGVASWLIGARPKLTAGQYADLLRASAKDIADPGWDDSTGFGLVDLAAALKAPTPPVDPSEPNDGITFVDGTAFGRADPYIWKGAGAKIVAASVDAVEDPVDVYRIRLGARRRATISLTPSAGNADLRVYDGHAKEVSARALARSSRPAGRTDTVHVANRRARARTLYVVVLAPSVASRSFDAPYRLRLKRG